MTEVKVSYEVPSDMGGGNGMQFLCACTCVYAWMCFCMSRYLFLTCAAYILGGHEEGQERRAKCQQVTEAAAFTYTLLKYT